MRKNLETADSIVKLSLASLVVIFYFIDVISGPFAQALMILSLGVIIIFLTKLIIVKF